jgi:phosphatidylserine/phosphatidylglycerophosphate/cardiolipin synthase-like enzyme
VQSSTHIEEHAMPPPLLSFLGSRLCLLLLAALVAGCAGLPAGIERPASTTRIAAPDAPLPRLARDLAVPEGLSAVRPMPMARHALAARLELIAQAQASLDLQTYLLADDATGHLVVRALRDAAERGVRVRLLLDDMYTQGLDGLLLGLAAYPNVEVRLYNPFAWGRGAGLTRLAQLGLDFERLNHRMHNKLFVADGVMAVAGGRNLADDYFLRSARSNFIDFDLLAAGAVVGELSAHFDAYWNSERVWPLEAIACDGFSAAERRDRFVVLSADDGRLPGTDDGRVPRDSSLRPDRAEVGHGLFDFFITVAHAHADSPMKQRGHGAPAPDTVAARLLHQLGQAQSEVVLVSPYFVPGRVGLDHIQRLRDRGVSLRVVTNATGTSDEPAVSLGYEHHRVEMLRLGVRLFEVSSSRLKHDATMRGSLGSSTGRLHAKLGFIDGQALLLGSLNLDARSALINTELGIVVRDPELTRQMLDFYRIDTMTGLHEVRLRADGSDAVEWVAREGDGEERRVDEPESSWWLRAKLRVLSVFVPEELL